MACGIQVIVAQHSASLLFVGHPPRFCSALRTSLLKCRSWRYQSPVLYSISVASCCALLIWQHCSYELVGSAQLSCFPFFLFRRRPP